MITYRPCRHDGRATRKVACNRQLCGMLLLFVAFAVTGWVDLTRLVRGQVLGLKEQAFVDAARANGVPAWRILLRHLLPNVAAPVIVSVAFAVPGYIMAEAGLSYLGLGVQAPAASWGSMVADSRPQVTYQPILLIMPAALIALVMIAFTCIGDGLLEALDPRLRR